MFKTKKLWPLFLNESLRGIAISWLAIFSSVFIYQRMLEVASQRLALAFVFFSLLIFGLGKILGVCWAEESSLERGLKLQLKLGIIGSGVAFILFHLSTRNIFFVIPAKLIWGFSAGIYWFGWHGFMGKLGTYGRYGRAFGEASLLSGAAQFLAPVIGGVLISFGGYGTLFLSAFGLAILALLAIFPLKEEKTHQDTSLKEVLRLFFTHKRTFFAYFSCGILGIITSSCFVLFLALILKKELVLGEFFSLSVLSVAVIRFFIGRFVDWQKRKLIVWGSLARSVVWLGRLLTKKIPILLGLNVVDNLAAGMVGMPLDVLTLEKAIDGHSTGRAVLFREVAIGLGQIGAGAALAILAILGLPLTVGFVLAIPLALTPILVTQRHPAKSSAIRQTHGGEQSRTTGSDRGASGGEWRHGGL